jgi:hypothetical protein
VQWVPEEVLKSFLVKQTYLERIELHGVQAVVLGKKSPDGINKARGPPPLPLSSHGQESPPSSLLTRRSWIARGSVVSRVIVHLHRHERLRTLELVDCGVTDGQANLLADFLHVKAGVRLSRLSLRLNKTLGWEGLRDLCQAPVMDQLDLSLCDLHAVEAQSIAASIAKRPWPLRELTLSGNSHIETSGWIALTSRECCNMLTNIDLSYCVVSCAEMVSILDSLRQNLSPTAALREINMQGCARWHQDDEGDSGLSESLCRLLRQGNSLRVVRLNDPRPGRRREDSRNWSNKELSRVLEALRHNYEIELLLYDSWRTKWVGDESSRAANIRNDMDFVLRLNQAGRRILLDRPGQPQVKLDQASRLKKVEKDCWDGQWLQVLENAGKDDLSVLYWVVRESAHRFGAVHDMGTTVIYPQGGLSE